MEIYKEDKSSDFKRKPVEDPIKEESKSSSSVK